MGAAWISLVVCVKGWRDWAGWWFVLVAVGLRLLVVAVAAGFWAGTGRSGGLSSTCYR